jgi:hypothetical protein
MLPDSAGRKSVSNSCPITVPLASFAVFWLPPESRKLLKDSSQVHLNPIAPTNHSTGLAGFATLRSVPSKSLTSVDSLTLRIVKDVFESEDVPRLPLLS